MSVFGFNQVGEMIIGKTYASESNIPDFISDAAEDSVQMLSSDSTAVALNKPFKVLQKTSSASGNIEFTEEIDPKNIISIKTAAYQAPVDRVLTIEGFTGTIRPNATYEVFIRLLNDGGSLSPENFRFIPAFYVTPDDVTGLTFADILNDLKANLDKSLAREGNTSLTVAVDTGDGELSVTGGATPFSLGKLDGRPVEYELQAAVRSNGDSTNQSGNYFNDLTVVTTEPGSKGSGAGTDVANLEWFIKGNKYTRYRDLGGPVGFDTPYLINPGSTYHIVNIAYYQERAYTNVEKQHRALYVVFENADQDAGGAGDEFTAVNAFIGDLETVTGQTIADLS